MITTAIPYLEKITSSGHEGETAKKIILTTAEYLSVTYGRTALANMVAKIAEDSSQNIPSDFLVRTQEATYSEISGTKKSTTQWFAVIFTTSVNNLDLSKKIAQTKSDKVKSAGIIETVKIYKTKISNHFAIVLGDATDKQTAKSLVDKVRLLGIAQDAFVQQNREWTLVQN